MLLCSHTHPFPRRQLDSFWGLIAGLKGNEVWFAVTPRPRWNQAMASWLDVDCDLHFSPPNEQPSKGVVGGSWQWRGHGEPSSSIPGRGLGQSRGRGLSSDCASSCSPGQTGTPVCVSWFGGQARTRPKLRLGWFLPEAGGERGCPAPSPSLSFGLATFSASLDLDDARA